MNESKPAQPGYPVITQRQRPFLWGGRMVQLVTQILGETDQNTYATRKILIDCETDKELKDLLDLGSHVATPMLDGTIAINPVVDADKTDPTSSH